MDALEVCWVFILYLLIVQWTHIKDCTDETFTLLAHIVRKSPKLMPCMQTAKTYHCITWHLNINQLNFGNLKLNFLFINWQKHVCIFFSFLGIFTAPEKNAIQLMALSNLRTTGP